MSGETLQVAAAEEPGFRDRYYPRLRHAAAVISKQLYRQAVKDETAQAG